MMNYIMVARYGNNNSIDAYALVDTEGRIHIVKNNDLAKDIRDSRVNVANMCIKDGKLQICNGSEKNYTLLDNVTGQVVGSAKAVILSRIEIDGTLKGYVIFDANGNIRQISIEEAVGLAENKLVSNGKIRETSSGKIVQSIEGEYPRWKIETECNKVSGSLRIKILYFAQIGGTDIKYAGVIIEDEVANEMTSIAKAVKESNSRIVERVKGVSSNISKKDIEAFRLQRTGINGIYGVIETEVLGAIIKKYKAQYEVVADSIIVSNVVYDTDGVTEVVVKVDKYNYEVHGTTTKEIDNYIAEIRKLIAR